MHWTTPFTLNGDRQYEADVGITGEKLTLRIGKKTTATGTTGANGKVTVTVTPTKTTSYSARYAGTAVNGSFVSTLATVKVKKAG